jgi:hypothetical protein
MLWVFGTSWLAAIAAATYSVKVDLTPRSAGLGIAIGLALAGLTAAAMFPWPAVFAFALGCVV